MHYVYKVIFHKRLEDKTPPYYYIGSKSNASYNDGVLYDSRGNEYYGSSTWENYHDMVKESQCSVEVIKVFDSYTDALNYESEIQADLDVVSDPEYFNLAIATINNFTDPNYATYKHIITGKTVRLPRNHKLVEEGIYVGVTKGVVLTEAERKSRGRSGADNAFYGKTHSDEVRARISKANKGRPASEATKKAVSARHKGVPKSKAHRDKISRKGLMMLKNINTEETIRIPIVERSEYDANIWVSIPEWLAYHAPYTMIKCTHCGKEGKDINSSFMRWHFDNCRMKPGYIKPPARTYNIDRFWQPWYNKPSATSDFVYSKLFEIEKIVLDNKELSAKKVMSILRDNISTEEKHRYYLMTCRKAILSGKFNEDSKASLIRKIGADNEN